MNVLGFEPTSVAALSFNSGEDARGSFDDITIDDEKLLPNISSIIETGPSSLMTLLSPQHPHLAVEWIQGLLNPGTYVDDHLGPDEIPLYTCPIDYDLLCGGVAMTVALTPHLVRWSRFRYISTAEDAVAECTALLSSLSYEFQRTEYETTLIKIQEKYRKMGALQ